MTTARIFQQASLRAQNVFAQGAKENISFFHEFFPEVCKTLAIASISFTFDDDSLSILVSTDDIIRVRRALEENNLIDQCFILHPGS